MITFQWNIYIRLTKHTCKSTLLQKLIQFLSFVSIADEAQHRKSEKYDPKDKSNATHKSSNSKNNHTIKANNLKSSKRANLKKRSDKSNYSHNWLMTTLKGTKETDSDMNPKEKYIATCENGEKTFRQSTRRTNNMKCRHSRVSNFVFLFLKVPSRCCER